MAGDSPRCARPGLAKDKSNGQGGNDTAGGGRGGAGSPQRLWAPESRAAGSGGNPDNQPAGAALRHRFDRMAGCATAWAGSPWAFASAVGLVIAWAVSGPLFGFSETWQLVINTGTTVVTFLMVFLIQQGQNKDAVAVHLKLNELLASHRQASNHLISIEDLDEEELRHLSAFYRRLAELADKEGDVKATHSLDDYAADDAEGANPRHGAAKDSHDRPTTAI